MNHDQSIGDAGNRMVPSPDAQKHVFSPAIVVVVGLLVVLSTNQSGRTALALFGLLTAVQIIHLLGFVLTGMLAGTTIEKIMLFMGKEAGSFRIRSVNFAIGWAPVGSSVAFEGMGSEVHDGAEPYGYRLLPLGWRLAIPASGPLAVVLLSSVCIGVVDAAHSLVTGFGQVVEGAYAPMSQGAALLGRAESIFLTQGYVALMGVLSAKSAAFNLLPIPLLNGGQLIMELLGVVKLRHVYYWYLLLRRQ